nr:GrpB family protein [Pseudodesulfovibrio sp. S3-i]
MEAKIERVLRDRIELLPYDPAWPERFEEEKRHLQGCLPEGLLVRIEHFGSTSLPGMTAKPVIDMLVEVTDLDMVRTEAVPILEAQGYDCFWRPQPEGCTPRHYPWSIKRDRDGRRTHHIHMTVRDSTLWEGLAFRDYLLGHPDAAARYGELKRDLAVRFPDDRVAYTEGKTDFVREILDTARKQG